MRRFQLPAEHHIYQKARKIKTGFWASARKSWRCAGSYDCIAGRLRPGRTYFFPSVRGDAYSAQSVTEMFRKCWEDAGNGTSGRACTPYDLRHAYAFRVLMGWVEQGRDLDACIPYLGAYMGHERFQDTYYYVHMLPQRLAKMGFMKVSGIVPEVEDEKNKDAFWPHLRLCFSVYLPKQRNSSPHTVAACRDTWNLLLRYLAVEKGMNMSILSMSAANPHPQRGIFHWPRKASRTAVWI